MFKHTFGKTLRGHRCLSISFVIKKCTDLVVCPVKGLLDFVRFAKSHKVDLSMGYSFRTVAECCRVLDKKISYSVVYGRLRYYLSTLVIYEGETPNSFRSGSAITMALSESVEMIDQVMNHVGCFGKSYSEYYCRMSTNTCRLLSECIKVSRICVSGRCC